MNKIKIAIFGCGRIFSKHYAAINKLNKIFSIESVCDLDVKKIQKKKYQKIKIYNNIEDLLKNTEANLAVILTPSGSILSIF